ncbi:esterase family protein [Leucobacter sp. wl10]|uniref:alpha/beta hydrolase n=1 Tax=Leucobacter sp. wl10 TaxID=2304677 RepID=UPI0013C34BEF|nr:alpha/beta hydrolase-fold protein [Leucobacter sp. wl10]
MPHWERLRIDSHALAGNLLGDSPEREVAVYLPPNVEQRPPRSLVLLLHGYAQRADTWTWPTYLRSGRTRASFGELLDGLAAAGEDLPIVAVPDGWTSYGGSQWIDSPVHGDFQRYLSEEVVPALLERFPSLEADRLGVIGYSSGGLGAWEFLHRNSGRVAAAALLCASGNFELTSRGTVRNYLLSTGRSGPTGPVEGDESSWLAHALGAAYSPNPEAPFYVDLPFDTRTGVLREEIWQRWLSFDPVVNVGDRVASLERLEYLLLDAGDRDGTGAQFAHRALSKRLAELGIAHEAREFEGFHSDQGIQRAALAVRDLTSALGEEAGS